ncbi:MAG: deoxynucleoside kinase [Bacteroidales bacterium]|nr:deoxynucleoside kinase [Bacteroidales bacterium]MBN2757982.1 deoxynucleoside kinase [Bacteroidales bacterium]
MSYNFIVIEGLIGAGKTSLSKKIAKRFNSKLVLEQFADNPFLPKFYKEPEKYSFQLELSFLAERYKQLKNELGSGDLFSNFLLSDYYFTKSLIFAKSTLQDDEYKLFRNLFNIIHSTLPKPDLYVYLHLDVDNALKNIKTRGRDYEQSISKSYLEKISKNYFDYFKEEPNIKFLVIDTNGIDFVNKKSDFELIIEIIFKNDYKKGINRIIL